MEKRSSNYAFLDVICLTSIQIGDNYCAMRHDACPTDWVSEERGASVTSDPRTQSSSASVAVPVRSYVLLLHAVLLERGVILKWWFYNDARSRWIKHQDPCLVEFWVEDHIQDGSTRRRTLHPRDGARQAQLKCLRRGRALFHGTDDDDNIREAH